MPSLPEIAFATYLALCLYGAVKLNQWHRKHGSSICGECESRCPDCAEIIATW